MAAIKDRVLNHIGTVLGLVRNTSSKGIIIGRVGHAETVGSGRKAIIITQPSVHVTTD